MAGNMLGADLDGLTALSQRLDLMSAEVVQRRSEATSIATDVVGELDAAISRATTRIDQAIAALESEIQQAVHQTESTDWNGANRATFASNQSEFNAALGGTLGEVRDAYSTFQSGLATLSGQIDQLRDTFSLNLSAAEDATNAMSRTVAAQRDALDAAMNTGI